MAIIVHPSSHEHWLRHRAQDITSTEIAALYGVSPYNTELELYHHKRNGTYEALEDNERMKWGRRLQDVIAAGIAEDYGWKIKPMTFYARHSTQRGMGASFDFEVIFEDGVKGILEIKAVDFVQHRDNWIEDGNNSEAPVHIEFQLQHQLEVMKDDGYERGAVGALVSGNKPIVIIRDRDADMGRGFCERIEKFWCDVNSGNEPVPNFERDGELLRKLYPDDNGNTIVLNDNNRAIHLCNEYMIAQQIESAGKTRKEIAANELLSIIGPSQAALIGDFEMSAKTTHRSAYTVDETNYRNIRVKRRKAVDK